ncbi:MAG: hypothetical protein R3E82_08390 [Pseudomonadales bacterium]|nr:hypothetical protein [Pseudomonadales bacterium]
MAEQQRRFARERQPLLPLSALHREINRRDERRETADPQQMDLLAPPQFDLFTDAQSHPPTK